MSENIIIVDKNDDRIGSENKEKCHDGEGILHRGFVVMVLDNDKRVLLAKRSVLKRLWPGFWDATVASHVREGETVKGAAQRRIREELGIDAKDIKQVLKFHYQVRYKDKGSENEICYLLVCRFKGKVHLNESEISSVKLVPLNGLLKDYDQDNHAPWMRIACDELVKGNYIL